MDPQPTPTAALQQALGYSFARPALLERALVHRSFANDTSEPLADNERLEFLGDAVLGLVIADHLARTFPGIAEGRLTQARAALVQEKSLGGIARSIDLGQHILLGRGELEQGGRDKDSILSDGLEAVFGAVYRDGGLPAATSVVLRLFSEVLSKRASDGGPWAPRSARSLLQETVQRGGPPPTYRITGSSGPPHQPVFTAEVTHRDELLGAGEGTSKQAAKEDAARDALSRLPGSGRLG